MPVFPIRRTEAEVLELRRYCAIWSAPDARGSEKFWAISDIVNTLGMPGSLAFFAAETATAPWQGVLFADCSAFTCDLLYVFVPREHRRAGVAKALLEALLETLRAVPAMETMMLEVRASNLGAQALYENLGLSRVGRRQRYYADGEDAFVYKLELHDEAP